MYPAPFFGRWYPLYPVSTSFIGQVRKILSLYPKYQDARCRMGNDGQSTKALAHALVCLGKILHE